MRRYNKAQITLIIAIAIFIAIIAAFIFYITGYFKIRGAEPLTFEKPSIENYVNGCVKKTAEDGLRLLGKQGGFIVLEEHLKTPNFGIAYLYNKVNKVPSIEKMQNELSFYINNNLNNCLKDFNDFKKQGWDVEKGDFNTKTQINQEDVLFEVNLPLKVLDKGNTISFEKFMSRLNIRLKYIHDLINKIVDFNAKNPKSVDRTALSNYDADITIFPYEKSVVYVIDDTKSLIIKEPYRFNFALKFE